MFSTLGVRSTDQDLLCDSSPWCQQLQCDGYILLTEHVEMQQMNYPMLRSSISDRNHVAAGQCDQTCEHGKSADRVGYSKSVRGTVIGGQPRPCMRLLPSGNRRHGSDNIRPHGSGRQFLHFLPYQADFPVDRGTVLVSDRAEKRCRLCGHHLTGAGALGAR